MSEPTESPPPTDEVSPADEGEMLQFDQAEFATPAAERPICSVCQRPIAGEYYEISGKVLCPQCRHGIEASFRGGSRAARFYKALAFGLVAAAIGAVIYYAFVRMTQTNWALISILVGFMVGAAIRRGTGNRGGRLYQLLAVFLTYSSIVAMNVPLLLEHVLNRGEGEQAANLAAKKTARGGQEAKAPAPVVEGKRAAPPQPDKAKADAPADGANAARHPSSAGDWILLLLVVTGFFYSIPVLETMHSPISGLIYGFALWEAWKINKPIRLVFSGPFRLGTSGGAKGKLEGAADE